MCNAAAQFWNENIRTQQCKYKNMKKYSNENIRTQEYKYTWNKIQNKQYVFELALSRAERCYLLDRSCVFLKNIHLSSWAGVKTKIYAPWRKMTFWSHVHNVSEMKIAHQLLVTFHTFFHCLNNLDFHCIHMSPKLF